MHRFKALVISFILVLAFAFTGCNTTKQKPAPIRPIVSQSPAIPTKPLPGTAKSKKDIEDRLTKVEDRVQKRDWSVAGLEVSSLGGDMTRYYPGSVKGKSFRDMAVVDADYGQLKVAVRAKNRDSALKYATKIRRTLNKAK